MKLLASVTGPQEAEIVLRGGAEIVDLKDPSRGALGSVTPGILAATIAAVGGRRPVSTVAGDLPMRAGVVLAAVEERAAADDVKIGLFPAPRAAREAVIAALSSIASRTGLIAVFFADGDFDPSLLPDLAKAGFKGAMVDTMGKGEGGLLRHLPADRLADFVSATRQLGLSSGLAGGLEEADVPRLAIAGPDYLGFRGALTAGSRDAPVELHRVERLKRLVSRRTGPGRCEIVAEGGDHLVVKDYVLPLEIGAYGFERGRSQKVRFDVEAEIDPVDSTARSIADIYSYDLILDAIRGLAARGHTDLVETLAVELAETILGDGRVRRVTVSVEKLELGPAAVGIRLTRGRRPSP